MNHKELRLSDLAIIFKNRFLPILLTAVLCAAAAFAVAKFFVSPKYTATASLYVYSDTNRTNDQITSLDLSASQELVGTYIVVLKSDTVLDQVARKLNLGLTAEDFRRILDAGAIDGTEAFRISVTYGDAHTAQLIANTIVDIAPREIVRVVQAGGAEVIDAAKLPIKPSSPNIPVVTILGALVGLILSFGISIGSVVFDTRVRCEEDLKRNFTIAVLGCVPVLDE